MNRLFQPFSQVDSSITRIHGGTGLGLAIAQRLAEGMGGQIRVESKLQQGSCFEFSLIAKTARVASSKSSKVATAVLKNQHILIVDDAEINRRILSIQAEYWGMIPKAFEKPHEALEWLKEKPQVDIALLDLHMPLLSGCQLAREIHSLPGYKTLPLVLLSSSIPHKEAGVVEIEDFAVRLLKPLRHSALLSALCKVLDKGKAPAKMITADKVCDPTMATRLPFKILLVEDNAVNQKVATTLFQRMGYRVDVAANGKEAVEAVMRQPYDVVFMDIQMPVMDGIEATRQILASVNPATRPYIAALTANVMKSDRELYDAVGMDDFIPKPVRADEIVKALERASFFMQKRSAAA
jgi:CheY-like chemotaxis protein